MSKSYQRAVEAIIDNIIENSNVFKLKSILEQGIEQDKEKDAMSKAINSALSILNDTGKEMVIKELLNPNNKRLDGIIDSNGNGNVNIMELKKQTTNEAIDMIEAAEKEGINLRQGMPVFKENKISVLDGAITLAAINIMVNNFKELSYTDRQSIIDNWDYLTDEQINQVLNTISEELEEEIPNLSQDEQNPAKKLKNAIDESVNTRYDKNEDLIIKVYKTNRDFIQFIDNINKGQIDIDTLSISEFDRYYKRYLAQIKKDRDLEVKEKGHTSEETRHRIDEVEETSEIISNISQHTYSELGFESQGDLEDFIKNNSLSDMLKRLNSRNLTQTQNTVQTNGIEVIKKINFPENIVLSESNELSLHQIIENIFTMSTKNKIELKQIKEALSIYKDYIVDFADYDEETMAQISLLTTAEITDNFLDDFNEMRDNGEVDDTMFELLSKLAEQDFNGNIQQILTNPELLQETFLPALQAEIQKLEQPEKVGVEQSEKPFEESKKVQPQEQSSTFNQETIRDELSAIPVALSNIEGIDKADIIAGMQGYKQLLDSIDVSSLQGKSNEDVLRMLMERTASIGLEGNANEILLMMSQIGFSKDGNMQIADILAESKEAFTALVDEASKEENIDKAIQENQSQTPITDKEATPGMRLLIEDLSFAKENENQLGDQVVANDGAVSDTVSTSGSDDTQGNAASSKLKPKNLLGLIISRNVRTSNIPNPEQIMNEYSKDGKNETNKKQEKNEKIEDEFGK